VVFSRDSSRVRVLRHSKSDHSMFALTQKEASNDVQAMSALPPKADITAGLFECPLCAKSGHMHCRGGRHSLGVTCVPPMS
jgi:hypothetical protein